MKLKAILLWLAALIAAGPQLRAEESPDRSVHSVWALEWGAESILDTYLSPLRYHGTGLGLSASWQKNFTTRPELWVMHNDAAVRSATTHNPAHNARMFDFDIRYDWGASRRFTLPRRLQLFAGASAGLQGGVIYLPRNGNNPASAKAELRLSLTAGAEWHTRLGRMPLRLVESVRLPSLSAFFSPQYGETYYEIYLGNHKGLAHCGWWGNHFAIDNLIAADLGLGRTALRVGYRFDARTSWVNHINTQVFTHALVIGVIPGGLGSKTKHQ